MVNRGDALRTRSALGLVLVVLLVSGCGRGAGTGGGPTAASTAAPSTPTTTSPPATTVTPSITPPTGITITAKFSGGLGRASITVPRGWTSAGGFANIQASAQTRTGDQMVDLILAPGASHFPPAALARSIARNYKDSGGRLGTIHPPITVAGATFAYVTGSDGDGLTGATFAVNVPLDAGGYGGISVTFDFFPSVPASVRKALYRPILASLTFH